MKHEGLLTRHSYFALIYDLYVISDISGSHCRVYEGDSLLGYCD
jgi:hypothetical protein